MWTNQTKQTARQFGNVSCLNKNSSKISLGTVSCRFSCKYTSYCPWGRDNIGIKQTNNTATSSSGEFQFFKQRERDTSKSLAIDRRQQRLWDTVSHLVGRGRCTGLDLSWKCITSSFHLSSTTSRSLAVLLFSAEIFRCCSNGKVQIISFKKSRGSLCGLCLLLPVLCGLKTRENFDQVDQVDLALAN